MGYPIHPKPLKALAENGIDTFSQRLGLRSIGLNNAELSIVIVNYRSWKVLEKCLDSFAQFTPNAKHEIIVVDNDSQDGMLEGFSQQYPNVRFIQNTHNHGFSHGCNLGASHANGSFLLFLNPDTLLTSHNAIDDMLTFAKNNANIGITTCRKINLKGKPEREMAFASPWLIIGWIRTLYKMLNKANIAKKFPQEKKVWHPDWVAGSVVLITKELFEDIGRWNQKSFWMYYEDVDLCKRIKFHHKEIALLRNVELQHAHGGSSRKNPNTAAITKSEVVTSSHVYIQLHTRGLNKYLLHLAILSDTLISQLIKTLLTLPIFWKKTFKANALTLIATIKYYIGALMRLTWRSSRLKAL